MILIQERKHYTRIFSEDKSESYKYFLSFLTLDNLLFFFRSSERLLGIYLECSVHASAGQVLGVLSESDPGGDGGVLADHLESLPLLAEVHTHVRPRHRQERAARVEAKILHLNQMLLTGESMTIVLTSGDVGCPPRLL